MAASILVSAQDTDTEIKNAIAKLSASTAKDGKGSVDYGKMLHDDFSRWKMGSEKLENKKSWLAGIDEWFVDGWRVADRTNEFKEIKPIGNLCFVRRNVSESYIDAKGTVTEPSKAAVSEVWIKSDGWKLLRVEVTTLD